MGDPSEYSLAQNVKCSRHGGSVDVIVRVTVGVIVIEAVGVLVGVSVSVFV